VSKPDPAPRPPTPSEVQLAELLYDLRVRVPKLEDADRKKFLAAVVKSVADEERGDPTL
jgi:hypothetical protein